MDPSKVDKIVEQFVGIIDDLNETIRTNSNTSDTSLKEFIESTSYLYDEIERLQEENDKLHKIIKELRLLKH